MEEDYILPPIIYNSNDDPSVWLHGQPEFDYREAKANKDNHVGELIVYGNQVYTRQSTDAEYDSKETLNQHLVFLNSEDHYVIHLDVILENQRLKKNFRLAKQTIILTLLICLLTIALTSVSWLTNKSSSVYSKLGIFGVILIIGYRCYKSKYFDQYLK